MFVTIPNRFAKDTITREGDAGQEWLDRLPDVIEDLCIRWNLRIDGSPKHGYLGLAVPVGRDGDSLMLKVAWKNRDSENAADGLRAWNGRGAVRLIEHDDTACASLLERLDADRSLANVEIGEAIEIAGGLLRRLAIPAPDHIFSIRERASGMQEWMPERWEQFDKPFPCTLLDEICEVTEDLAASSQNLMSDYDLHYRDILSANREPWLMIDPKPISGDPEFCLAQLLWTRLDDVTSDRGLDYHFRKLVDVAELDLELSRKWTIVRCADYWLWGLTVGLTHDPIQCESIIKQLSKV